MANLRYSVNHNFFDTINADSAYFLGLLSADGNVSRNRITLSLCLKDSKLLTDFRQAIKSSHPITNYSKKMKGKEYPQKIFRFNSPHMCNILQKYGIIPKKSLKLTFPDITNEYITSFIRGYFDGDGSITITKSNNIFVTILGTETFLLELKRQFNKTTNTTCGWVSRHNKSRIFHFCIHGNISGNIFLKWIYSNSTSNTRLNRKYNKWKSLSK